MSIHNLSPDRETNDMIKQLERSYRERLNEIDIRSRQEQNRYEALEDSLKRQVQTLREEIDLKNSRSSKVTQGKRSQIDQRISTVQLSRDQDFQEKNKRLFAVKEKYFKQRQDFESDYSKLLADKTDTERENRALKIQISDLTHEIEVIQGRIREVYSREIVGSKREIEGLKVSYESIQKKVTQEQGFEMRELQYRLDNCERTIEDILYDIQSVKREEENIKEQAGRDISYLRESLNESQREITVCEEKTSALSRDRDLAKNESMSMSRVTGGLETDLGKLMKTNTRLNGKVTKLERLVYGTLPRSPSKTR